MIGESNEEGDVANLDNGAEVSESDTKGDRATPLKIGISTKLENSNDKVKMEIIYLEDGGRSPMKTEVGLAEPVMGERDYTWPKR